jgi:hypothetical protein
MVRAAVIQSELVTGHGIGSSRSVGDAAEFAGARTGRKGMPGRRPRAATPPVDFAVLRYDGNAFVPGAQTKRRDNAGPMRACWTVRPHRPKGSIVISLRLSVASK